MSKNPSLILAVGFVAGCGAAIAVPLVIPPAHAQTTQRWETLCVNHSLRAREVTTDGTNAPMTDLGNRAGREGWELVSTLIGSNAVMCFKRPAP